MHQGSKQIPAHQGLAKHVFELRWLWRVFDNAFVLHVNNNLYLQSITSYVKGFFVVSVSSSHTTSHSMAHTVHISCVVTANKNCFKSALKFTIKNSEKKKTDTRVFLFVTFREFSTYIQLQNVYPSTLFNFSSPYIL